jgi:hypothetical protein
MREIILTYMTEAAFKATVADILGPEGEGFYIEGELRPWVVLCGEPYDFKTADEAIAKARELAAME